MKQADEIKQRLANLPPDQDTVEKVDLLNELSQALWNRSSMAQPSQEAIEMARRLGYQRGEAYGLFHLGSSYWFETRLEEALATLLEADATFREIEDPTGSAKARMILGSVYRSLGDYDQAYLEGLDPAEYFGSRKDLVWESRAHLSLALTCFELGDMEGVLKHSNKMLDIVKDSDEQWIVGRALIMIGTAYDSKGDHREALQYYLRSLKACKVSGHRMGEARALHELGRSYERIGSREKAQEHYQRGLDIREEINQREAQCTSLLALGELVLETDTAKAFMFLLRALAVAEEVGAKPRVYQAHLALSRAYEANGDLERSLEHYKLFHQVREEVVDFTNKMRARNLRTVFEVEKQEKEAEIARLKESLEEGVSLGSYRLTEQLGSGGMGEVWLGRHRLLTRPAAIKLMHTKQGEGPGHEELEQRFRREAEVTSSLRSPHTVQLYDFGVSDGGAFYYVMEYLEGMDLGQMVDRFGPMRPDRAILFLRQACRSLAEAHDHGLVHRDIKPANLFAARLGEEFDFLKVLDFGMVKAEPTDKRDIADRSGKRDGNPCFHRPGAGHRGRAGWQDRSLLARMYGVLASHREARF